MSASGKAIYIGYLDWTRASRMKKWARKQIGAFDPSAFRVNILSHDEDTGIIGAVALGSGTIFHFTLAIVDKRDNTVITEHEWKEPSITGSAEEWLKGADAATIELTEFLA